LQWGAVMLCGKPWHRSRSSTNSLAPTSICCEMESHFPGGRAVCTRSVHMMGALCFWR
jgi:hypothetical protein